MSQTDQPVLYVIVRRFRPEFSGDIEKAIESIQKTVADQPGFIGLQNRITPKHDGRELVTIVTFDTQKNLERWENSPVRRRYAEELDRLSQDCATNTRFDDLSRLVAPTARISKLETVLILIAWILVLGHLLRHPVEILVPDSVGQFWQSALTTAIIVVLISYVLLPVSSLVLTRIKARLSGRRRT
ncbi:MULTISPECIES: antibiotic biosynthesis monooxygenase [unclassified Mameliella]|uniref:antibiotic biosynthesis monooxygenase n=1 Tax=unclassified Mameliella TaxID=2630630 RepID=UPI00273F897F|nr:MULTISPECIES: antibiotic biosynthesis monooxygenase [unclassified Mameliella]